jgi:L-fucose mutarotase
MEVVGGKPHEIPEIQEEFQKIIDQEEGRHVALVRAERHSFYEKAKNAYAIVATGEPRPYVNVLLNRGVVLNQTLAHLRLYE